ncbi:hypothetical protein GCM10010429_04960 [Micromonospora olivasterospora]
MSDRSAPSIKQPAQTIASSPPSRCEPVIKLRLDQEADSFGVGIDRAEREFQGRDAPLVHPPRPARCPGETVIPGTSTLEQTVITILHASGLILQRGRGA